MTKLLIKNSEQLEISKIENSEDTPSYTYETLTKLNLPKENLFFILGSDTAMKIRTWKNYKDLSNLTNFLVALRSEDNMNLLNQKFPFNYQLIEGQKLNLSSTDLRKKLQANILEDNDLPLEILKYIREKNLY